MERKVGFLGPLGTFTEEAAHFFFTKESTQFVPFSSIPEVLDAVNEEKISFGVVPLENSIEGTVNLTMDWLIHQVDLPIRGELAYPIEQQLVAAKAMELSAVKKVLSHPQAIAQCHHFLSKYMAQADIEYTSSTAQAVKTVSQHPGEPWAAIGTHLSASIYPVQYLRESVQDHSNNYTRFILVSKDNSPLEQQTDKEKTSVLVTLPADFPGALYQVLAAFAWRKINLSKLESRPTKKALGNYHFIIDVEQKMDEVLLPGAFAEIEAIGCQVRFLGSYPYFIKKEIASTKRV
jgi:prephenate dehydratase